jgi:hypothetical protein
MAQTLKNLQNIAEFDLFPVFNNQIGYAPSPFIEKIQKVTLKDPGISANTPVGANGGVGYGSESAAIPESGAQMYERFKIAPVDLYGNLEISDKALTLGSGDSSINLMIDQVEGIKNTMSFMMGRSIIAGNGSGVVCTVSASTGATKEFTVSDTRGLVEGMKIDFYANGGTTPAHAKKRIASIDRNANKITVEGDAFNAAAGFITYQGSYKNEILGIEAFFDDTVTNIYGVDKTNKSWIKPEVDEFASGDIDAKLRSMVRNSERYKDGKIDMMLAGDEAYEVYLNYLKESKLMPVERQHFQGGVSAIEVLFGNRKIAFVNERHVAPDAIVGVDTSSFLLPMTPVGFLKHTDGSAFQRKDNSSIWQAVIGTYLNLICKKPGAQFKLTGVVAKEA